MELKEVIKKRRAYRSLKKTDITDELINDLAEYASLAPSCFNKQPWRFVFVKNDNKLREVFTSLSKGNEWAYNSSMIVAVVSEKKLDCVLNEREYFLFDTGMATGFLILRATDLGLIAHPIAGYDEDKVMEILNIPKDMRLITMVIVGERDDKINPELSEFQTKSEKERPERLKFERFASIDKYDIPEK